MRRLLLLFALSVPLIIAACDSGGSDPEPVDVTVRPTYMGDLVPSATLHAGDEQVGTGETTLTREQGASVAVRAEAEGFGDATANISFDREHTEAISLVGDSVVVGLRAENAESNEPLPGATLFAEGTEIGTGETEVIRARSDEELSLRAEAAGFGTVDTTVSLIESRDVTLSLLSDSISVTVRAEAAGGDTLVANAPLFLGGQQIGAGEATVRRERSSREVEVRAEAPEFFEEAAVQTVGLEQDRKLTIPLDRKTVTLQIDPEVIGDEVTDTLYTDRRPPYGPLDITINGDTVSNAPLETAFVGFNENSPSLTPQVFEVTHPMSRRELNVEGDVTYASRYDDYASGTRVYKRAKGSAAVSATSDTTLVLRLDRLPACSDGIDNWDDGVQDQADPGCTDGYGRYDPETDYDPTDNREILKGKGIESSGLYRPRSTSSGYPTGPQASIDSLYVSSSEGRREISQGRERFYDPTAQIAVGRVQYGIRVKRSSSQDGETFTTKWVCAPRDAEEPSTTTMLDIVPDNQEQDGWAFVFLSGLTYEAFQAGLRCQTYLVHGTKARGEPPSDGEDDVIRFIQGEDENYFYRTYYSWFWEPEEREKLPSRQTASAESSSTRGCNSTSPDQETCTEELLRGDEWLPYRK